MATRAAVKVVEAGLTSSLHVCTPAGDDFINTGIEFIRIQNTHASAIYTVKVTASGTTSVSHPQYGTLAKENIYKAVAAAGNSVYIGPFKQGAFNDSDEKVQVAYKTQAGGVVGTDDAAWTGLSTTLASAHLLKIEVLYLDN